MLSQSSGFTLVESLAAAAVVGLLMAIAAPSFLGFWQQRKINITQDMIYQALRITQSEAMQLRCDRRFSIREQSGRMEWASHDDATLASQITAWQPLVEGVGFATIDNTLLKASSVYYIRFDMYGNVKSQLGTVTVAMTGSKTTHRCVVVSTMLGAMRKGTGRTKANGNERFCY